MNNKNLFVLPFDHRASFAEKLLGYTENMTDKEKQIVTQYKQMIYESIYKAIEMGIPKESSAVLVDEVYGLDILKDAKANGLVVMQTVEKSGLENFEFEYGDDFGNHLLNVNPTYAKALIRYDVLLDNSAQLNKLKILSEFVHKNNIMLLIEPLMKSRGDQKEYDKEYRYIDQMQMMKEMGEYGIKADIWKIEGLYEGDQYRQVVDVAKKYNTEMGVIILGRNETKENVLKWINAGKNVEGVIGFAIGRTIFWGPLTKYKNGMMSRDEAIHLIAKEYFEYYKEFMNK